MPATIDGSSAEGMLNCAASAGPSSGNNAEASRHPTAAAPSENKPHHRRDAAPDGRPGVSVEPQHRQQRALGADVLRRGAALHQQGDAGDQCADDADHRQRVADGASVQGQPGLHGQRAQREGGVERFVLDCRGDFADRHAGAHGQEQRGDHARLCYRRIDVVVVREESVGRENPGRRVDADDLEFPLAGSVAARHAGGLNDNGIPGANVEVRGEVLADQGADPVAAQRRLQPGADPSPIGLNIDPEGPPTASTRKPASPRNAGNVTR